VSSLKAVRRWIRICGKIDSSSTNSGVIDVDQEKVVGDGRSNDLLVH